MVNCPTLWPISLLWKPCACATINLKAQFLFGLGDLANLTEINLTFNQLTGIVPSALYQVPIHRFWGNQVNGTFFLDENGQQDMSYFGR